MKKIYFSLSLLFLSIFGFSNNLAPVVWNGYEISYVGRTKFNTCLDTKDVNSKLRIVNLNNLNPVPIFFQLYIEGLNAENPQRDNHGDGGFAVFPNGGGLLINQGDTAYVQSWLSGVYENRFHNTPPALEQTKAYNFHFLFSESSDALNAAGFPKDASTVADVPVKLNFTHSENLDVTNGDLHVNIEVNTDNNSPFYVEIATELGGFKSNMFNTIKTRDGDDGTMPYVFKANVENRNDWVVKIGQPQKETQIISVDPDDPNIKVTLKPDMHGISPYHFKLISSINTPTGFWRGAVSESERTFLAVPGQENWNENSSPKTASKIYKYTFGGTKLWDFDFGWEAWGGDMSQDGKVVVVASNNPQENGKFNPSGGDYILVIDGLNGNLLRNIPGIETKSLKISHDDLFVAIGSQQGFLNFYNLSSGQLFRDVCGTNYYGQVREILWGKDDASVYVSTGDGYLRKYMLNFGDKIGAMLAWEAYVGGWAFVNGLNLNEDFNVVTTGTKDKSQTVINTIDGTVLWTKHTGHFDSKISTDGKRLVTFGGKVFQIATGQFTGYLSRLATTHFFHAKDYILAVDRANIGQQVQNGITVHSMTGDLLSNSLGEERFYDPNDTGYSGGEQVQWSYLSDNDSCLIVLSRDMDNAFEVGISIYEITDNEDNTLSVKEAVKISDFVQIYPNPVRHQLNLSFSNGNKKSILSVRIVDMNGKIIKNIKNYSAHQTVNVKDLKSGAYALSIETLEGKFSSMFLKE